eukprot:scaffold1017_cov147-Chaetoceros_neogracile.AAC.1
MTLLNSQTGNMAASGDEEKQNLGEETTSLLKLKEEIGNQKASFKAFQIEVKSLLAHKLRKEEIGNQKAPFEALQIELTSLRAHVDNTNTHVLRPASSSAIKQDSDTDNELLYTLPSDTFTLMMVYNPLTPAWNIGIFSFILQMLLLILILISQIMEGDGSTPFNVPFKVDNEVRIGQFAVIIVCVLSQDDVLTSLQGICALWKCGCTAFQDLSLSGQDDFSTTSGQDNLSASRQDDLSASGQDDLSTCGQDVFAEHYDLSIQAAAATEAKSWNDRKFYALHILLPNLLKFGQGVFVLLVSLVIIVQGDDLIDLLKDSTALFFVSTIDNVIFFCATAGYFGQKVGRQAQVTTEKVIVDVKKWSFQVRSFVVIIIGSLMISALSTVTYGQVSGNYFILQYPDCDVTDNATAISKMMNGICDGGELNTLGCAFDGGDCINHNLAFPRCNVKDPEALLGNGVCDGILYNTPDCMYDDGDCIIANYNDCHSFDDITLFGDGICHLEFNTASCGNDKGDCDLFNSYPNCNIPDLDQLGDGTCNTSPYNSILCGFDGGDCVDDVVEARCKNQFPDPNGIIELLGDGECNAVNNNQACSWDGKDCLEFNANYPDCVVTDDGAAISNMTNGICDGGELNTLGCAFDGGDCINHNLAFPGCNVKDPEVLLGNGVCDGGLYNTPECKYDDGDCIIANYTNCHSFDDITLFGDGVCHLNFNTAFCGNDKGDCDLFNSYPNCDIPDPDQLGDGTCNITSPYNSILCGFDGGDCVDDVDEFLCRHGSFPNGIIELLGDGKCDAYNNNQFCGWDGKDCLEFNAKYPACGGRYNKDLDPERIGDGTCDNFGGYNSRECGNDGSDCSTFNLQYPECEGENPDVIGDGNCDSEYDNVECGFDGYDCLDVDCTIDTGSFCRKYKERFPDCPFIDPRNMGEGYFPYGVSYSKGCTDELNVEACNFDGGACKALYCSTASISALCDNLRSNYPNCTALANRNVYKLGNFECNWEFNTEECGWDMGDCVVPNYPDCHDVYPRFVGDGYCHSESISTSTGDFVKSVGGDYNTIECGFDGGDCEEFNAEYPNCTVDYPYAVGNGDCNGRDYNTTECGFDGGDCDEFNAEYPDCNVIFPEWIGDGVCSNYPPYNTIECGFDGGDCDEFNAEYPDCNVIYPSWIGDGICNGGTYIDCSVAYPDSLFNNAGGPIGWCNGFGDYNTAECGFDEGDCEEFNEEYSDCNVDLPYLIENGRCDGAYNTAECGFDGGDCDEFNAMYPDCNVNLSFLIGDAICNSGAYIDCSVAYPDMNGPIGWCNGDATYNTTECGFDGGDCVVSSEPSLSPTTFHDCDVTTFGELQRAIDVCGDIKLGPEPIIFTEQIYLSGKQLTFTCPNGGCVLDAESNSRFFYIGGDTSTISFDGITFQNGNAGNGGGSGGAIVNQQGGTVDIIECRFIDNTATSRATDDGGAIFTGGGGLMVITGSEFIDNLAANNGNHIFKRIGDVTCNDGNTFNSPAGNYPAGLCTSTR